ncbi:hypothetical protein PR202_gb20473 [Eleusine coracana subsp. coracana]|uniref:F-box domain-containing protein n=1 Tax=Eleusine coracana subsp. coracana TaxID=191504 RepID=A0AAV5FAQ4_ELECO|nr:hypothetical protein PR202_gb20473 [Eleusine coracana subsp. coracana]
MPGTDPFSRLHDDLVAGILVLLPPKHVARARLVCRRWHLLTTDHHFVRTSFTLSRHAGRPVAGFFHNDQICVANYYFPLDRDAENDGDHPYPDLSFIPETSTNPWSIHVTSSCNGLLALICWPPGFRGTVYVCNPLTKKLAPLCVPTQFCHNLNIAFEPTKSPHFKLVALGVIYSIHVYSSETRSWKMAVHGDHSASLFVGLRSFRGVFWNGSIIWNVGHSLIRFVVEGEYLTNLPMPRKEKGWICAYVGESGGHLQMIGYTKKEKFAARFDILEMQEDQSEWSVLYHVDLSQVKELYPNIEWPTWDTRYHEHKIIEYLALSPIYVIRGTGKSGQNGVLIFSIPGKIMSYNMKDQKISMVQEVTSPRKVPPAYLLEQFWYNFYAYSPSLFDL